MTDVERGGLDGTVSALPSVEPVDDWASDYDIFDHDYVTDPYPIWADLREQCPIAHSDRWGGSWLPTRYDDVVEMARMVPALSSSDPLVVSRPPDMPVDVEFEGIAAPPITADPPEHTASRRLILPAFSPKATENHEPYTRDLCHRLIDEFIDSGRTDGAADYAQQIPPRVIAHLLGIDESRADEFTEWVRGVLELGLANPQLRQRYRRTIIEFFMAEVADRRANPRDDLISQLLEAELDGVPVTDQQVVGTCNLMLIAGIDTTWSSIGSALWHLASHPEDRERLVAQPDMLPMAIEELLRAYSPVTMARVVTEDVEVQGCPMHEGDKVLMNFPGANRDPEVFEDPDVVKIDRERNRHVAFGVGIHRCAGSNLARMEMLVSIGTFLERIPEFQLENPSEVTWAGGQVRGPRTLGLAF